MTASQDAIVRDQLAAVAVRHGVQLDRLLEEWSERAAIREYLGGMPRARAELAAVRDACEALGLPEPGGRVRNLQIGEDAAAEGTPRRGGELAMPSAAADSDLFKRRQERETNAQASDKPRTSHD